MRERHLYHPFVLRAGQMFCCLSPLLNPAGGLGTLVRPRRIEPPRVAPLAPQASASTNSATAALWVECAPGWRDGADVTVRF